MDDVETKQCDERNKKPCEQEHRDDETSTTASGGGHDRCYLWMNHHHLGCLARLPKEWPRLFSLLFGVVLPLFLLIGISLFFGYGLAMLEAPAEVEGNNDIIANRARIDAMTQYRANVTERLPRICLEIFAQDLSVNATLQVEIEEVLNRIIDRQAQSSLTSSEAMAALPTTDSSELLEFMGECGKIGAATADRFTLPDVDDTQIGNSLSFNWIRCEGLGLNSSKNLYEQIWGRPYLDRSVLKPDAQAATAIREWRRTRLDLYNEFMEDLYLEDGTRPVGARLFAFRQSLEYANGFGHCYPNSAAGAWFWFTVMTTIGYGNTAPTTQGGRAMIYTLGFFSILLFAVILGTAGTIVVTIWDDFINRTKLHQLNIPWVACLFWGCCYYAWMLVIAVVTKDWKAARLGEEVEFSEAYWFSYISTTTVGFGDYYLDHEVILRQDLFTFPLLFLTGFVFLANFFVKLQELLTSLVPRNNATLEETLATSDVPCLPKAAQTPLNIISSVANSGRNNPKVKDMEIPDTDGMDDVELASVGSARSQSSNYA